MSRFITIADLLKPFIELGAVLIMLCLSVYAINSLMRRFDSVLALFTIGTILDMITTTCWFVFGLQAEWKITLLPAELRRIVYLCLQVSYPFQILIWASAFFLFARRNMFAVPLMPSQNDPNQSRQNDAGASPFPNSPQEPGASALKR